ncbi:hypothetical protein A33Q_2421 [Indibacter alkaliphilus LW1]|jgi:hypothetical protein|uniref:Uncharacterized protein n=1 Tax=Indibacter alkaliphilus (strain CCUG 57479 / KCTC 22604 / LW1) TaxID=1189612 RepID=S2DX49_INDAL|nr:hypothetical protein [Indibacter alkaliphilus]EOZ96651.1 hypothetical protein A33Q_2421 [Indibacter alkaliphilus LW1]
MKEDLKKKAEELEQTLGMQLSLAKKESEDWVKVGAGVLLGGVVAFTFIRILSGKKNKKTEKALQILEREGLLDEEIEKRLTSKQKSGFMSRFGALLLPILISYGKQQFLDQMSKKEGHSEDE